MGRKPKDRIAIARAFVLKAVYNIATTKDLIELLKTVSNLRKICGISDRKDIASESTFSRAFAEFAENGLGERVHEALVEEYLSDELIGHISRDSTAIEVNEKPKKKYTGERAPKVEEKRINKQVTQSPQEALKEIPVQCDVGTKRNAKGYKETWIGYKFHIDATDSGFPVTTILTSASLHDSQVAIPMMKITTEKVTYLYDLMDSAYDAASIYEVSQKLQHVPIIDKNPRRGSVIAMSASEALRYNERSSVERVNGRLKEEFGGNNIKVRGGKKVKLHLMFGIIALFADQLIRLIL